MDDSASRDVDDLFGGELSSSDSDGDDAPTPSTPRKSVDEAPKQSTQKGPVDKAPTVQPSDFDDELKEPEPKKANYAELEDELMRDFAGVDDDDTNDGADTVADAVKPSDIDDETTMGDVWANAPMTMTVPDAAMAALAPAVPPVINAVERKRAHDDFEAALAELDVAFTEQSRQDMMTVHNLPAMPSTSQPDVAEPADADIDAALVKSSPPRKLTKEQQLQKAKMLLLLSKMSSDQVDRHATYSRLVFPRNTVRQIIAGQDLQATSPFIIGVAGMAKLFMADLIEAALESRQMSFVPRAADEPLRPEDVRAGLVRLTARDMAEPLVSHRSAAQRLNL